MQSTAQDDRTYTRDPYDVERYDGEAAQSVSGLEAGAGADFFAADTLSPLSLSRTLPEQVFRFFEHHYDPGLPSDFD